MSDSTVQVIAGAVSLVLSGAVALLHQSFRDLRADIRSLRGTVSKQSEELAVIKSEKQRQENGIAELVRLIRSRP